MKSLLLIAALASSASAGVVAPASKAHAASMTFDGAGPLKPWVELPGTPLVQVGQSLIDTSVFGARELLKSLTFTDERPVLGLFEIRTAHVLNAYSVGTAGVRGHSDALPQGVDKSELGGYTAFMRPDGSMVFGGSGSLPAEITPAVQRAVRRYLGVRPAVENAKARFRRLWIAAVDLAMSLGAR